MPSINDSIRKFLHIYLVVVAFVFVACQENMAPSTTSEFEFLVEFEEKTRDTEEIIEDDANRNINQGFTTEGKPTKTIETPWGPRDVYDYSSDPEIIHFFEDARLTSTFSDKQAVFWNKNVFVARKTSQLDLARIGCVEMITSNCLTIEVNIDEQCMPENNLGKSTPTSCEVDNFHYNMIAIPKEPFGPLPKCSINGSTHTSTSRLNKNFRKMTGKEFAELTPDYQCTKWKKVKN